MCKSEISLKKFLKLLLEIEFYRIGIYIIFLNILIRGMDERQRIWLMILSIIVFTIFPSFLWQM